MRVQFVLTEVIVSWNKVETFLVFFVIFNFSFEKNSNESWTLWVKLKSNSSQTRWTSVNFGLTWIELSWIEREIFVKFLWNFCFGQPRLRVVVVVVVAVLRNYQESNFLPLQKVVISCNSLMFFLALSSPRNGKQNRTETCGPDRNPIPKVEYAEALSKQFPIRCLYQRCCMQQVVFLRNTSCDSTPFCAFQSTTIEMLHDALCVWGIVYGRWVDAKALKLKGTFNYPL
jgi:hypothetical protein